MVAGAWLMVTVGPLQFRHEAPMGVSLAVTSFKAAVALTPGDSLAVVGELLTAAAAQLKPRA
jgi:hypothetical protein